MEDDYSEYSPWFPNPIKCVLDMASAASHEVSNRLPWDGLSVWLQETWKMHYICVHFPLVDFYVAVGLAVLITLVRVTLDFVLFKRIPEWYKMPKRDAVRFPASAWKVIVYSILWLWELSIIYQENYFFRLTAMWDVWSPGVTASPSLYWFYMTELALYIHSIYATLYLEAPQKDFTVLMIHHFVAIGLLAYSHCIGFHSIGLITLFLHDIGDIWLELSKAVMYFKWKDGKEKAWPEMVANCTFVIFTLEWILFRMYWFPTKAIYSAVHSSVAYYPNGPFYLSFVSLLCSFYVMHCYWFWFIMRLLLKVVMGKEIEDNRDIDDEINEKKKD